MLFFQCTSDIGQTPANVLGIVDKRFAVVGLAVFIFNHKSTANCLTFYLPLAENPCSVCKAASFKIRSGWGKIPAVGKNGVVFIDVKVEGRWKGGLAVNSRGEAVGIRWGGEWLHPAPYFSPEDVRKIRKSSLWNRFLSETPAIVLWGFPSGCLFVLPLLNLTSSLLDAGGLVLSVFIGSVAQRLIIEQENNARIDRIAMFTFILSCQTWAISEIYALWSTVGP